MFLYYILQYKSQFANNFFKLIIRLYQNNIIRMQLKEKLNEIGIVRLRFTLYSLLPFMTFTSIIFN